MNASVSLRADQRDVAPLAQQVGHAADVVLVAVGQHDRDDVVEPVPDRGEVGEDHVDAGLVLLGEQHAAVDDQQLAGVLEDGHVAADLAEPAQRDHAQAALGQGRRCAEFGMSATHDRNVTGGAPGTQATGATAPERRDPRSGSSDPRDQIARTFSACGPFWPCVTSNSTCWPSSRDL